MLTICKVRNTINLADSDVMLTLTQKTIQEARAMKTITLVALVYLPASFTAVRDTRSSDYRGNADE
jgi:hypothetical protein